MTIMEETLSIDLNPTFDSEINGNIILYCREETPSNSGKTSLVQNWSINSKFSSKSIKKVYWVSSLTLNDRRKNEIDSYFSQSVNFAKVFDRNELEMFIEDMKSVATIQKHHKHATSDVGEKTFYDKIIVFDDMSTIADKSKHFAHFLTVSRKYGYICIYILHNIAQNKNEIWQLILSNTNIVVLFKSTVISPPIVTILYQNVIKSTNSYVPRNDLWLFNVYKKLTVNEHLMIDNRDINEHSIGRFRSFSESPTCQLCFYGMNNNDRRYIKYVAKAINNKSNIFKVVESVGTTICGEFFRKKKK